MNLHAAAAQPVLLGLGAAAVWGAADFAGGLATRRARPGTVVLAAHGVSLSLLLLVGALLHSPALPYAQGIQALLSGVAGGIGLMLFYRALALGWMGLTAALAGLITTILPVTLAVLSQGWPSAWQMAGFAVASAAIVMIAAAPSHRAVHPDEHPGGRALVLAVLAGVGFGLQLVLLHASLGKTEGAAAGMIRALTFSRAGGAAAALLALALQSRPVRLERAEPSRKNSFLLLASTAGLLDTAGNLLYMLASVTGRLDVAAVLSSLYPAGTILLAAWLLKERTTRIQAFGMAMALLAVALISR